MKDLLKIVIFMCFIIFILYGPFSLTLKSYKTKTYKNKLYKKQNVVNIIPDEIDFNSNSINNNYEYNDKKYTSPANSYAEEFQTPKKFSLPVVIKNFDDEIVIEFKSKAELKILLLELEKELYKILLFIDEPKYLKEEDKKLTVNDRYPFAYYNPTREDKLKRAEILKKKIIEIKKKLGQEESVEFLITVRNCTFPNKPDDIVNHYEESYSLGKIVSNTSSVSQPGVINGNFTDLNVVYDLRKTNFMKDKHTEVKNSFESIKLPYHNQILDYIKNKHKK
jgi:hypothetical protein